MTILTSQLTKLTVRALRELQDSITKKGKAAPKDPEDMKKGGSIKKKIKKGKVKKRASLRGQGKALRGF